MWVTEWNDKMLMLSDDRWHWIMYTSNNGSTCGIMVIIVELVTRVQILEKANCVSFHTNAFGKGMNPFFLF